MFAVKFSLQLLFLFPLFLCMVVHGKKKQKLTEIHVIRDWSKSIGGGGGWAGAFGNVVDKKHMTYPLPSAKK